MLLLRWNPRWLTFLALVVSSSVANRLNAAEPNPELGPPRDVVFTARLDGTPQNYVVQLPPKFDATRSHGLLIALHGHGSDRWQFVRDTRGECRAARDAAAKHGLIYVSPDYRAKTSWMGPAAEADLVQIIDDLHQQFRLDRIIVCGGSMGGTSALAFTALHPELVDGMVSMNGTANMVEYAGFADAIAASYGGTKAEKPDHYRQRSAEFFPERLTMPVAITTGGRDTLVPPDSCLRLAHELKQRNAPVRLIHRPEGGHETTYEDGIAAFEFALTTGSKPSSTAKPLLTFDDKPRTIVCLGDSVTGVYYHTGGWRAYPEMIEIGLRQLFPQGKVTVVNAGISGNTTQDGLARLDNDVLSKKPDLVTISFGLNDMVRIAPDQFRTNLETLIKRCRAAGSQVVLCTPNAVIDTGSRPNDKLIAYCDIIRAVGRETSTPVCDQFLAGTQLRKCAPWTWRCTLSDEIHPNMDGHKRMAEELIRTITGRDHSLANVTPPLPALPRTRALLQQRKPIRVLAMPPYDGLIAAALKEVDASAMVEVTTWPTAGKSLAELEQEAKTIVRPMKPDLVIIAVPRDAKVDSDEQFVRAYTWIMNWSLSFGHQEWDCLVVHPSVAAPEPAGPRDALNRQLILAQHLNLLERAASDSSSTSAMFSTWLKQRLTD